MTQATLASAKIAQTPILAQLKSLTSSIETEDLFPIAFYKDTLIRKKRTRFAGRPFEKIVVLVNPTNLGNVSSSIHPNLGNVSSSIHHHNIIKIAVDSFTHGDVLTSPDLHQLDGALVILTNNNVGKIRPERFAALVDACPGAVFAVHDFDNHHWFDISLQIAAIADVYVPAHLENYAIAGRVNSNILQGIPCGTIQWHRSFLLEKASSLLTTQRETGPLGIHAFYKQFHYRNRILATMNQQFPKIGFLSGDFHNRTPEDRWNEWVSYKLHWIAPVFNDLPIRFFDALVSGGIPLVPTSLAPYLRFLGVPEDFYICYAATDLLDAQSLVQTATTKFAEGGQAALMARHLYALEHFHVDAVIKKIIMACEKIYCQP